MQQVKIFPCLELCKIFKICTYVADDPCGDKLITSFVQAVAFPLRLFLPSTVITTSPFLLDAGCLCLNIITRHTQKACQLVNSQHITRIPSAHSF